MSRHKLQIWFLVMWFHLQFTWHKITTVSSVGLRVWTQNTSAVKHYLMAYLQLAVRGVSDVTKHLTSTQLKPIWNQSFDLNVLLSDLRLL